ncbi:MAG: hypothetical protein K8F52_17660 [Candidatus Scalindua rubra]|uniref:Uncharacterized protein n=1 Tax=Candidatus Scalindua brodae TaxID=237368 RepID=A0A0B0ELN7_9BACT|nr:MAG: hypothetical protein SCABRO_01285 [Candidatus Scalindua brodae]MBZ0110482.1 hypothetical protein [Candidatus Scalindua rubra]TWU36317.1 hypothetical protein S225a_05960 [Candidatus Brocadiaceae bacterium S225]
MNDISDSDLQMILELSVNVGTNYLMWYGAHEELTTKQIRDEFDCSDELLKVLDDFDPERGKSIDSKRLAVLVYEYLNKKYSKNHGMLYRVGFSIAQQTLGLSARLSTSDEEDSGKSVSDILPEHMKNLKSRLKGILPADITKNVLELVRNKIEEAGLEVDIGDLLVQVFNKVAFPKEGRKFTVTVGEEQKTYQTFTEMIGDLLSCSVQVFTKSCMSLNDLNNKEKFMMSIGKIATDFLKKNKNILQVNESYFLEELRQSNQSDAKQPAMSLEELVFGAIGGMAEGYWLKHKQQKYDSPN